MSLSNVDDGVGAVTEFVTTWHAGPSMMPGGDADAYKFIEPIVTKVAAQVGIRWLAECTLQKCLPDQQQCVR